ncbi:MAG: ribonuclease P protein component [Spirochaetes bacterium]|nr:ribonuclease P protein component [Spirochaetota bacterium]
MKQFGIQKKEHIKLQNEMKAVFQKGKQYSDKYIKIFILKNNRDQLRFAVAINKKFGTAVLRNKAKRQIRDLFRCHKGKINKGYDIIFFLRNEFNSISFFEKTAHFIKLLERSGLIEH